MYTSNLAADAYKLITYIMYNGQLLNSINIRCGFYSLQMQLYNASPYIVVFNNSLEGRGTAV